MKTRTKIYLDVCCLNRPFDDQTQDRIHMESEAVETILGHVDAGQWQWVGSSVVDFEIGRSSDLDRRARVGRLAQGATETVVPSAKEQKRAKDLCALGFSAVDGLHLACAEAAGVDVLLTTDDKMLRISARNAKQLQVRVENPLVWLEEITRT
ncbi:MAG: PIN domain-containing protein [Lentisphaerales bacterium]|nr:MAG: PIN domain-containing protein [Lentisphaerales bacterium]